MRKRFLSLLLATMCIAASLSACGTKTDSKEETTIQTANANTYKGIDDLIQKRTTLPYPLKC